MAPVQVRRLVSPTSEELDEAARICEAAFNNDAITVSLSGNNPKLAFEMFRAHVAGVAVAGELLVASYDDVPIAGISAWFPPGRALFDSQDQKEAGQDAYEKKLAPEINRWRDEYWVPKMKTQGAQALGENYKANAWYLQLLAVRPEFQGKGIGGALVNAGVSKAFEQKKNVLLDTSPELNVPKYVRWGFTQRGKGEDYESPFNDGFTMYVMTKEVPST